MNYISTDGGVSILESKMDTIADIVNPKSYFIPRTDILLREGGPVQSKHWGDELFP